MYPVCTLSRPWRSWVMCRNSPGPSDISPLKMCTMLRMALAVTVSSMSRGSKSTLSSASKCCSRARKARMFSLVKCEAEHNFEHFVLTLDLQDKRATGCSTVVALKERVFQDLCSLGTIFYFCAIHISNSCHELESGFVARIPLDRSCYSTQVWG